MSSGIRPTRLDWKLNRNIFDEAIAAVEKQRDVDYDHDIPYTAGYSEDGKTIYVDKEVPKYIEIGGKPVDVSRYFILHEVVEKSLLQAFDIPYQFAHQIALRVEQDAVEADNINWNTYNRLTTKLVNDIYKRKHYPDIPKDLDDTPYKDEDDMKVLERT